MGLILDSSVLIAAERGRFEWVAWQETLLDEAQFLSVITLSELLHGVHRAQTNAQREKRERFISGVERHFPVLDFSPAIARVHAELWAKLEKQGQMIGAHDLMIAATAICFNFGLATLNLAEFRQVPDLRVLDMATFQK